MTLTPNVGPYYNNHQISILAQETRYMASCAGDKFNILWFLEYDLPDLDPNYRLVVLEDDNTIKDLSCIEAVTEITKNSTIIYVRESIYCQAFHDNARSRFTLAHELGHALLHRPADENIFVRSARRKDSSLERSSCEMDHNAEIQANKFAAELLAPTNLIKGMSIRNIMLTFGVSRYVAKIQQSKAALLS